MFGDSAKEILNFFTIRHKKALHEGVQGAIVIAYFQKQTSLMFRVILDMSSIARSRADNVYRIGYGVGKRYNSM